MFALPGPRPEVRELSQCTGAHPGSRRASSAVGSAPPRHGGGPRFDSGLVHDWTSVRTHRCLVEKMGVKLSAKLPGDRPARTLLAGSGIQVQVGQVPRGRDGSSPGGHSSCSGHEGRLENGRGLPLYSPRPPSPRGVEVARGLRIFPGAGRPWGWFEASRGLVDHDFQIVLNRRGKPMPQRRCSACEIWETPVSTATPCTPPKRESPE